MEDPSHIEVALKPSQGKSSILVANAEPSKPETSTEKDKKDKNKNSNTRQNEHSHQIDPKTFHGVALNRRNRSRDG